MKLKIKYIISYEHKFSSLGIDRWTFVENKAHLHDPAQAIEDLTGNEWNIRVKVNGKKVSEK